VSDIFIRSQAAECGLPSPLSHPEAALSGSYQLHFRPARIDGLLDTSTRDTLKRLIAALPVTVAG